MVTLQESLNDIDNMDVIVWDRVLADPGINFNYSAGE